MKIEFIGVGEAFEPELGNASYLIHSETKLLVDCGYGVPRNFFSRQYPCSFVDALYITHFHGDHTFGIPALLSRWNEDHREKTLTIIGQPGIQDHLLQVIDLAYPFLRKVLKYKLKFIETTRPYPLNELMLSFGKSHHSQTNYAIKISNGKDAISISGDGELTDETKELFYDTNILIHEAFGFEEAMKGHTTAKEVFAFASTLPHLKILALVHIQRVERKTRIHNYLALGSEERFDVIIPEPGEMIST